LPDALGHDGAFEVEIAPEPYVAPEPELPEAPSSAEELAG
jgi:hypothetical protein